jgi:hypothetical protein
MASIGVYNSNEVSVFVSLIPILEGRAKEGFLSIAPTSDDYTMTEGADGFFVRNAVNSKSYNVTLKLLGASPENAKLAQLRLAGLAAGNGADIGPFMAKNALGEFLLVGDCYIAAPPEVEFGSELGDREWKLVVVEKGSLHGS